MGKGHLGSAMIYLAHWNLHIKLAHENTQFFKFNIENLQGCEQNFLHKSEYREELVKEQYFLLVPI